MSERDLLKVLLWNLIFDCPPEDAPSEHAGEYADAILAAGYRKPSPWIPADHHDGGGYKQAGPEDIPWLLLNREYLLSQVKRLTPRRVTSAAELDALRVGSVVACLTNMANIPLIVVFQRGSNNGPGVGWTTPEAEGQIESWQVLEFLGLNGLPMVLTVLHEPGEGQ